MFIRFFLSHLPATAYSRVSRGRGGDFTGRWRPLEVVAGNARGETRPIQLPGRTDTHTPCPAAWDFTQKAPELCPTSIVVSHLSFSEKFFGPGLLRERGHGKESSGGVQRPLGLDLGVLLKGHGREVKGAVWRPCSPGTGCLLLAGPRSDWATAALRATPQSPHLCALKALPCSTFSASAAPGWPGKAWATSPLLKRAK